MLHFTLKKMEDCLFESFSIFLLPVGDILKANDDLSRVIGSYKRIVEGQADEGEGEDLRPAASEGNVWDQLLWK